MRIKGEKTRKSRIKKRNYARNIEVNNEPMLNFDEHQDKENIQKNNITEFT